MTPEERIADFLKRSNEREFDALRVLHTGKLKGMEKFKAQALVDYLEWGRRIFEEQVVEPPFPAV